jgi:hypothetical protein
MAWCLIKQLYLYSALQMEVAGCSEMLVPINLTTWHYIPGDSKTNWYNTEECYLLKCDAV